MVVRARAREDLSTRHVRVGESEDLHVRACVREREDLQSMCLRSFHSRLFQVLTGKSSSHSYKTKQSSCVQNTLSKNKKSCVWIFLSSFQRETAPCYDFGAGYYSWGGAVKYPEKLNIGKHREMATDFVRRTPRRMRWLLDSIHLEKDNKNVGSNNHISLIVAILWQDAIYGYSQNSHCRVRLGANPVSLPY